MIIHYLSSIKSKDVSVQKEEFLKKYQEILQKNPNVNEQPVDEPGQINSCIQQDEFEFDQEENFEEGSLLSQSKVAVMNKNLV